MFDQAKPITGSNPSSYFKTPILLLIIYRQSI
jgi:hypothetical protein